MAIETSAGESIESDVREGSPLDVPNEPLAQWLDDRVREYAELPAAHFRDNGRYVSVTYEELYDEARLVAGGLVSLGLEPGDRLAIRSGTRYEWSVVDLATLITGVALVPVYPTFSPSQASYVIEDAGADVLVSETVPVEDKIQAVVDEVIDVAELPTGDLEGTPGLDREMDDVASQLYTSGTTGDPKGVKLTHGNFRFQLAMLEEVVPQLDPGAKGTCFLPLSHAYQRLTNYNLWNQGHAPVFIDVDTLVEDLKATEPEMFATVPRVYRRMYDGVQDQLTEMSGVKESLLRWSIDVAKTYGKAKERNAVTPSLELKRRFADRMVYSKLREEFGMTNIEFAITGAASLDAEILYFFWGLGVDLLEGYGATETCAGATFNRPEEFRAGTVGKPLPGTAVKLDADGEVLIQGPHVMAGYWNLPEKTADTLIEGSEDHGIWYRTGDIGEWDGEYLKIVDRKKRMAVMDTGKNVYPNPIETAIRRSEYVEETMVIADGRKFVSALVQPNFDQILAFADQEGIEYDESAVVHDDDGAMAVPRELIDHPDVHGLIKAEIESANDGLADYETVKQFVLIERALSVEKEELTPTLKKRRRTIESNFADRIESVYQDAS
ncbi:MAG: AMP-dependent synthetase/ligase [Natronomonas sp.]